MQQMSLCYANVNGCKACEQDFPLPDMGAGLPHLHRCVRRSVCCPTQEPE